MSFNTSPMTGTGQSSNYTLFAVTETARIGFIHVGGGKTRVRVEPQDGASFSAFPKGWLQPDGGGSHNRFSIVVPTAQYPAALLDAFRIVSGVSVETKNVLAGDLPPVKPVLALPTYNGGDNSPF